MLVQSTHLVSCAFTSASGSARRCSKLHTACSFTSVSRIARILAALTSAKPPTRIAASTAPMAGQWGKEWVSFAKLREKLDYTPCRALRTASHVGKRSFRAVNAR